MKLTLIWKEWYEIFDADAWDDITFSDETMLELQSDQCGFEWRPTKKEITHDIQRNPCHIFFGIWCTWDSWCSRQLFKIYDSLNNEKIIPVFERIFDIRFGWMRDFLNLRITNITDCRDWLTNVPPYWNIGQQRTLSSIIDLILS